MTSSDEADDKVREDCCPGKPFVTFRLEVGWHYDASTFSQQWCNDNILMPTDFRIYKKSNNNNLSVALLNDVEPTSGTKPVSSGCDALASADLLQLLMYDCSRTCH